MAKDTYIKGLDPEVASKVLGIESVEVDPLTEMRLEALDTLVVCRSLGIRAPSVDPKTGVVFDTSPTLVPETTGLEKLDVQEIYRHRYSGQYPGEPKRHFLGGSSDVTFGGFDKKGSGEVGTLFEEGVSPSWNRVKGFTTSREERHWRNAYHQIGFIADRLDLPNQVREDITRAYANLREKEISEAYKLEELLGLLAYVACRIHKYPRGFKNVKKAIDELYDIEIEKDNVTRDIVKAFNNGRIRFSIEEKKSRKRYLETWQMIRGKRVSHGTFGRI